MKKVKKKQSEKQKVAVKRNWHKGIIKSMSVHCNNMKNSKSLILSEQMKILKCKAILEDLLANWKPSL